MCFCASSFLKSQFELSSFLNPVDDGHAIHKICNIILFISGGAITGVLCEQQGAEHTAPGWALVLSANEQEVWLTIWTVCNWSLDFLTNKPQIVNFHWLRLGWMPSWRQQTAFWCILQVCEDWVGGNRDIRCESLLAFSFGSVMIYLLTILDASWFISIWYPQFYIQLGLGRCVNIVDVNNFRQCVVPNRKCLYLWRLRIAPLTQRPCINTAAVRQFSAVGQSHSAKHCWNKDEPPCNSHRKLRCRS